MSTRYRNGAAHEALDILEDADLYRAPIALEHLLRVVPRSHVSHPSVVLLADVIRHTVAEIATVAHNGGNISDELEARQHGRNEAEPHIAAIRADLEEQPLDVRVIRSVAELRELADELGVEPSWHEPDEQGVTVTVTTTGSFDNAATGSYLEQHVVVFQHGEPKALVNLAMMFGMITGGIS